MEKRRHRKNRRFLMPMPFILDAHQDLAYNMTVYGRDYRLPNTQTRLRDLQAAGGTERRGSLLGLPEYNAANVGLVFGTLFAAPKRRSSPDSAPDEAYDTPSEARRIYWKQLDFYHHLAETQSDSYRLVLTQTELKKHLSLWQSHAQSLKPIGIIPLMEGAEGIVDLDELPRWWERGLRIIGLAWAGNRFCGGTREPGGLTSDGKDLIRAMAEIGFVLDLSHMDEPAALTCLDIYPGKIIASHANAAKLVRGYNTNRLLSDEVIAKLIARGGCIGVAPINSFLDAKWREEGGKEAVSLRMVAEQIDYICQMAGDVRHVGLGTDFDGGLGVEDVPAEIDTIADLPKLFPFLEELGYDSTEIESIASGNFLDLIQSALPA
ncbi:MAG TPA: membrane dipeptidase [Anaerolineaceae bacterium]|nr:membrane dipeptidase [Anaerolineaceae bacterium]